MNMNFITVVSKPDRSPRPIFGLWVIYQGLLYLDKSSGEENNALLMAVQVLLKLVWILDSLS